MDELWAMGAIELADAIRQREVSSREVVQAHLDRIAEINGAVNAVVRVLADEALAAADAADAALAADCRVGPLHGVPITVKENIDVAGTPTTHGVNALAEAVAGVDSPQVQRMRAAGAIPFARTNLPDFALRVHTESQLHGLTRNPWDPARTAGGSSGGEAAALATGMSPLGLGNDLGGSLRNPAHCCGVASIKPTAGAVPTATVIPPVDLSLSFQLMAVEGAMARRVEDVRAAFVAIAGPHPRDPRAVPAAFAGLGQQRPRVAVLAEPPGGSTHPGIAAVVQAAADVLADEGFDVVEATPPDYERTLELWASVLAVDLRLQEPVLSQLMGPNGRRFLEFFLAGIPAPDLAGWAQALTERHGVGRRWNEWFEQFPVLLCPVWTQPAFPVGFDVASAESARATVELMRPVLPANLLGTPAAVVAAGMADGLPVGVQLMGARFSDLRCLDVAEILERELGLPTPLRL